VHTQRGASVSGIVGTAAILSSTRARQLLQVTGLPAGKATRGAAGRRCCCCALLAAAGCSEQQTQQVPL
jgi:hypothetical protein